MGKLQAALDWAARGFPVFPLAEGRKEPIHDDWPSVATTDPSVIAALWTDPVLRIERDFNIGTLCSNRVVVDIDVKNGKDGVNEYAQIGGHYDTLVVATPSGGYHCYFDGPDSSNSPLSNAIDIRSHNGFVVAPGSYLDGSDGGAVGWYQIATDRPPVWVPLPVANRLSEPYARRETSVSSALDSEASIAAAIGYLQSAPPAVEGQRGDETTFVTAARLVREMALSEDMAAALMWEHFNPRCQPPWSWEEICSKVQNAAAYGTADMGRLDPSVLFASVEVQPPPSPFEAPEISFGNAILPDRLPPRPWLMDRLLMRHESTVLLAQGSAGKSSIGLAVSAHLALGLPFGPFKARRAAKSIVYNGEDNVAEQSRRLMAVCDAYSLDYAEVRKHIMLLDEETAQLTLAFSQGGNAVENTPLIASLIDLARPDDIGLIVYDPLVDVHSVDENDNPQMNVVLKTIKRIAREADVASLIMHHATKAGGARQEERTGNPDIARGASAIINKSRISFTLMGPSSQDCEDFGLQDAERSRWVRMDDAKMNLALSSDEPVWFQKRGVALPSGDTVGALVMSKLERSTTHIRVMVAEAIFATMEANGTGSMPIGQAVAVVKQGVPLWANKTDTEVKKKIEGMFATAVEIKGRTLHAKRDADKPQAPITLTMT